MSAENRSGSIGATTVATPDMASMATKKTLPAARCSRPPLRAISATKPEAMPALAPAMCVTSAAPARARIRSGVSGAR